MNKPVMDRIYKYPLNKQITHYNIPLPAKFLSLGKDANGDTCVWFITNPDNPNICSYRFDKYGTGWLIDRNFHTHKQFLGTVVEEPYVWHIFMSEEGYGEEKESNNIVF